jgi:hypothetical protein
MTAAARKSVAKERRMAGLGWKKVGVEERVAKSVVLLHLNTSLYRENADCRSATGREYYTCRVTAIHQYC